MNTHDGAGLLAAILADPTDDVPRLIYADWLGENGQGGQSNFIRWQMATPLQTAHVASAKRLWYQQEDSSEWFAAECPAWAESVVFQRGFISEVRCALHLWIDHGQAICAAHPVERVEVTDREPDPAPSSFGWYCADYGGGGPYLPRKIWDLLDVPSIVWWKDYETRKYAVDALSRALLVFARPLAPFLADPIQPAHRE